MFFMSLRRTNSPVLFLGLTPNFENQGAPYIQNLQRRCEPSPQTIFLQIIIIQKTAPHLAGF